MADGPNSELVGATSNVEAARGKPNGESSSVRKVDNLGTSNALGALNRDKPDVKDRTDLVNLASVSENNNNKPETAKNPEFLNPEMVGAQAILLLGPEAEFVDWDEIEQITTNGKLKTEGVNKLSSAERTAHWDGKESIYKKKSYSEKLKVFNQDVTKYLSQFRNETAPPKPKDRSAKEVPVAEKPEAQFFARMGVDVHEEKAASRIYNKYFVEGLGDVKVLVEDVVKNNTAEQIKQNRLLIEDLAHLYGEKSAKIAMQLIDGYKNAKDNPKAFIENAQQAVNKGNDMPGADLVDMVSQNSRIDRWDTNFNRGSLNLRGDFLTFTPNIKEDKNPYQDGTIEFAHFEKYHTRFSKFEKSSDVKDMINEARERTERGIELTRSSDKDPTKKELSQIFWDILNENPNILSRNPFVETVTFKSGNNTVRGMKPQNIRVDNESINTDIKVNLKWAGVQIDRYSLPVIQQKAIEYLEQKVANGLFSEDLLKEAKTILESHKNQTSRYRAKIV